MKYAVGSERIGAYRREITDIRQKIRAAQAEIEPQEVADYGFKTPEGTVHLSELFKDHSDLMVVHNMGSSCPSCTLWADGYNGVHHHLITRTSFAVLSPDPPEVQRQFAQGRGWKFPMVSHMGTNFAADMGYRSEKGGWRPDDDFCTLWHFFDLLPEGAAGWSPKLNYP